MFEAVGINPKDLAGNLAMLRGGGLNAGSFARFGAIAGLAAPVAIGLMVQPVTEAVVAELQRPGGFLDKRIKIIAEEEAFAGLERMTRQKTRIGDRQVIIQQFEGFRTDDGNLSTNTSDLIRENADRVLDIGLFDRASGVR